jgi:hypothetical protein
MWDLFLATSYVANRLMYMTGRNKASTLQHVLGTIEELRLGEAIKCNETRCMGSKGFWFHLDCTSVSPGNQSRPAQRDELLYYAPHLYTSVWSFCAGYLFGEKIGWKRLGKCARAVQFKSLDICE